MGTFVEMLKGLLTIVGFMIIIAGTFDLIFSAWFKRKKKFYADLIEAGAKAIDELKKEFSTDDSRNEQA